MPRRAAAPKSSTAIALKSASRGGASFLSIRARCEVILSAGTMTSPRLLMVSGIGPPATLAAHGIPLVHANALVGAHLQDHPVLFMTHLLNDASLSLDALNSFPMNAAKLAEWLAFRKNELASCAEMTGYIRSSVARAGGEPAPDVQIAFIKAIYLDHGKASSGGRAGVPDAGRGAVAAACTASSSSGAVNGLGRTPAGCAAPIIRRVSASP